MNSTEEKSPALEISLMQPEDAGGVVELYRAVYGSEYPVKTVYDPAAIIEQQQKGDMIRIIACAGKKVVGQLAAYRSSPPNPRLYEEGQAIVLPEYRNRSILQQCVAYGHQKVYPGLGLDILWGEAVCNHTITQKAAVLVNYIETGLEIDLMPASSYEKEKSSSGRVSTVLMFKTFAPAKRTVYLPGVYIEVLRYIYQEINCDYSFFSAEEWLQDITTEGKTEIYEGAGVARITVMKAGSDFESFLKKEEKKALSGGCRILQVYLDLSSPFIGGAVKTARRLQYFFGGALPGWFGGDGLLLQRCLGDPNWAGINLYTERSRRLLSVIRTDRETVLKGLQ